jgi:magnesium transporter
MRVLRYEEGKLLCGGPELACPGAPIWVDLAPTPENLAFLGERFHFHPLALDDCAHEDQRVKFDQYPESVFTVVHRVSLAPDDTELLSSELDSFLTAEALVTVHGARIAEVDRVFERCRAEPELLGRGADFALYLVFDAVTDLHFSIADALTAEIEELADEVVRHGRRTTDEQDSVLDRIVMGRRMHTLLRKRLSPQREVFAALARPGQGFVRDRTALYFRDVVDHAVRLTEEIDTGRDLLASAMDAVLSHANNRLSMVMARLTLISTIFLPLNFMAGFFGMNLEILPAPVAIPLVFGSMVAMPFAMIAFFRHKRWM